MSRADKQSEGTIVTIDSSEEIRDRNGRVAVAAEIDHIDSAVDAGMLETGAVSLELIENIRASIDLLPNPPERRLAQMCQAFFVGKIHRVTRAMLTLIMRGQGQEATSLLREQHEFIVALLFYQMHPGDATLFIASHPLTQLDMAKRHLQGAVSPDEQKTRQDLVDLLQPEADASIRDFPDLIRPCPGPKRCKKASSVHVHEWRPKQPKDMLLELFGAWLKGTYARIKHSATPREFTAQRDILTDRQHLARSHFVSQDKHGLPFALSGGLKLNELSIEAVRGQVGNPNDLVFHIIGSLEPIFTDTVRDNGITGFGARIDAFKARLEADKIRLGIADGNPAITAIRDAT